MDLFGTLGIALGLAMLAGINLYLTIFMTGLAVKLGWFGDSALTAALEGFGHPAVIAVALGLFVVQFIIDKIPWLDSLWDSIHTFLKPAGGVLLALTSLGPEAGTLSQVFVALIALAGSLLTHGVKASTRLAINTSPEPFSNIGASIAEDLLVIGGFALLANHPTIALFVFAAALALFVYLTPRVTRAIRAILWLIWKKLRVPAGGREHRPKKLPTKLSADAEALLQDEFDGENYHVDWCVPCVTGKTRNTGQVCRNLFGELIAIREHSGKLFFAGSRHFKKFLGTIDLDGALATHESRFISEGIVVHNKKQKRHAVLRFHRGQAEITEHIASYLQDTIAKTGNPEELGEPEPEALTENAPSPQLTAPEENEATVEAAPAEIRNTEKTEIIGGSDMAADHESPPPPGFKLPPLTPFPSGPAPETADGVAPPADSDNAPGKIPPAANGDGDGETDEKN